MGVIEKIKKIAARTEKLRARLGTLNKEYFYRKKYVWYRENLPVVPKMILLESLDGENPTGNIAAILQELYHNPEYQDYTIYLSGRENVHNARLRYLKVQGMQRVKAVSTSEKEYYSVLASAKYLITEVSFLHIFIKRPEQVYLNTWHGTPLKTLGKSINNDFAVIGNVQKNFFDADYLLCPNEFTMNVLVKDYMLENFGKTKLLLTGYPRNCIFFDQERREKVREACGFGDKQIIAFMPTWRGVTGGVLGNSQNQLLYQYFEELDAKLSDSQVFYVKLHQMNTNAIDLTHFQRIKPFPLEFDAYEFLNATDMLVTDYSSVFFDYANTGKKIVLFTYDLEEYIEDRGFYLSLEELPFPQVKTVDELLEEIARPKEYDDTEFMDTYCAFDNENVTAALCRKVILNQESKVIEQRDLPDNGKKNVILYMGGFQKNGITQAAVSLFNNLDRTKHNYAVIYCINDIKKRQDSIKVLPDDMAYFGFYRTRSLTLGEIVPYMLWREVGFLPYRWVLPIIRRMCDRDKVRIFCNCRIDKVIQYSGYSDEVTAILGRMPCSRTLYVHSDMEQEIRMRGNANKALLSHEYKNYDSVACVTEGIIPPTKRIAEYRHEKNMSQENYRLCKNVIDYKRILAMSEKEVHFDSRTISSICREHIRAELNSSKKKFISIGRFSPEKGHMRLISAFEKMHQKYPDTVLFILGGSGPLYNDTLDRVNRSTCPDSIFLIQYLSNPFAILRKCDYFVLSSFYEGFGLVLAEADILGLPCFSTDIVGPRLFMKQYGGKLVEDSEEGILSGLLDCMAGNVPKRLSVDYEAYNQEAVAQFEALIED